MKRTFFHTGIALLFTIVWPAAGIAQSAPSLDTAEKRFSYGIGLNMSQQMKEQGLDEVLDIDAFAQALRDVFKGVKPQLTTEQIQEAMLAMRNKMAEKQARAAEAAQENGKKFLAKNKGRNGVTTTASGLQYIVTTAGKGQKPAASDRVRVHYEGRLLNGEVFDSSYKRGEPAVFGVGQVIPGWQEALQLMSPGAKWELWLPSDIAYGPRGAGGAIGPNEVLNFTVELIEVVR